MAQNMNQANIQYLPQWRALGNAGDLPVGWTPPSGVAGSPSTSVVPPTITTPDFSSAYQTAKSLVPSGTTDAINNLGNVAANIRSDARTQADAITGQIPTVQNIYSDLAKTLQQNQQNDTETAKTEKTKALGTQAASAAASGFDPTQGFEAAQARSTGGVYDTKILKIAQQYGIQEDQLVQEQAKDIETLQVDAANAIATGDQQAAGVIAQQISARQQMDKLISDTATAIMSATTDAEKVAIQQDFNNKTLDLQQQQVKLDAQKLQIQKYTPVTTYNPSTGQTMVSAFDIQTGAVVGGTPGTASKSAGSQYPQPSASDQNAIAAWATDVKTGIATMAQVPASIKTSVATLVSQ